MGRRDIKSVRTGAPPTRIISTNTTIVGWQRQSVDSRRRR